MSEEAARAEHSSHGRGCGVSQQLTRLWRGPAVATAEDTDAFAERETYRCDLCHKTHCVKTYPTCLRCRSCRVATTGVARTRTRSRSPPRLMQYLTIPVENAKKDTKEQIMRAFGGRRRSTA